MFLAILLAFVSIFSRANYWNNKDLSSCHHFVLFLTLTLVNKTIFRGTCLRIHYCDTRFTNKHCLWVYFLKTSASIIIKKTYPKRPTVEFSIVHLRILILQLLKRISVNPIIFSKGFAAAVLSTKLANTKKFTLTTCTSDSWMKFNLIVFDWTVTMFILCL